MLTDESNAKGASRDVNDVSQQNISCPKPCPQVQFRMGDNFESSATAVRQRPDSPKDSNEVCNRIRDLVSTNNHKNDKLNELSQSEAKNDNNDEGDADMEDEGAEEDIDDDWFSKLSHNKELSRGDVANGGNSLLFYGLNYGEIPLLCDEDPDFKEKTKRTLRVGLKKIWRRGSATITAEDPTYKVAYLGNVLTGWAKGEGCIDKPLNTLWKNYNSSTKPDVQMKISVTQSGLKAVTKDHGLIEYWSHRITYCAVPPNLPRIFCWVYRHEGRKLKQELRCHGVLCSKESVAARMAATLKLRLTQALLEFKRDKLLRQNARLSLANSVYENPSLPRRKILLSTGSHNYKPPLERSKSAPKLMSIEESLEEEESTPKAKRKSGEGERKEQEAGGGAGEGQVKKSSFDEKCEYKLANLNFVKKLCSSIENLVESTSNYSKKFLTERKSGKDFYGTLKKPEETILRKPKAEEESAEEAKKSRARKNVSFERNRSECWDPAKCTDYRKLDEEDAPREPGPATDAAADQGRDQESDEGSNSLQSISSCCSDVSSLVTNSSDKSAEPPFRTDEEGLPDAFGGYETAERLHAYLSECDEGLSEEATRVILHPTGEERSGEAPEEDVASDESGYVELSENLDKRLSLDSKEKDLPYHKIIKSTMLRPGRTKASCLQI